MWSLFDEVALVVRTVHVAMVDIDIDIDIDCRAFASSTIREEAF